MYGDQETLLGAIFSYQSKGRRLNLYKNEVQDMRN